MGTNNKEKDNTSSFFNVVIPKQPTTDKEKVNTDEEEKKEVSDGKERVGELNVDYHKSKEITGYLKKHTENLTNERALFSKTIFDPCLHSTEKEKDPNNLQRF